MKQNFPNRTGVLRRLFRINGPVAEPPPDHAAAYRLFALLKRTWAALGSPAPGFVRRIRHGWLGGRWPAWGVSASEPTTRFIRPLPQGDASIVITSHNDAPTLGYAIESAIRQTVSPKRIIIVDDASEDDTADVARTYGAVDARVAYIRSDWRNIGKARNAALRDLQEEYLVFLDAKDALHPRYLEAGMDVLRRNPHAGIAYPHRQNFGDTQRLETPPPAFDWRLFDASNYISDASVFRRSALVQAGGWHEVLQRDIDWITVRAVLALGWEALRSEGIHFCRRDDRGMPHPEKQELPYVERSGLSTEPVTLFLSLSGRRWAWPDTRAFLEEQTLPHDRVQLCILDTSHDAAFSAEVRQWLQASDYAEVTYLHRIVGPAGLADAPRADVRQATRDACATIYNVFARRCHTALACFLEDDVIPPLDAFVRLIHQFTEQTVSVSALYYHRQSDLPVAWDWDKNGRVREVKRAAQGITAVGGTGFGCNVVRGERIRHTVFTSGLPVHNYDQNFYYDAVYNDRQEALLDWDCLCRHLSGPDAS